MKIESDDFVAHEAFLNKVDDIIQYSIYTYGVQPSFTQIESELALDSEANYDQWHIYMGIVINALNDM